MIFHQVLADMSRALLVIDVRQILISEMSQGGSDRVRRCLTECAERIRLAGLAQLIQCVQIFHRASAFGDPGQDLKHALGADTAG